MASQLKKHPAIPNCEEDQEGNWRIERQFRHEPDGTYMWAVYQRTHTGLEKPEHDAQGNVTKPGLLGVHPVHKGETHEEWVWVRKFGGTEEQAREFIAKNAHAGPKR